MAKFYLAITLLFSSVVTFAQLADTSLKYEPATVIGIKQHQAPVQSDPNDTLYEVSVRVDKTVYVVLTTPPSGLGTLDYAVGRELLVNVGDKTIIWNDIMGQSHEVPIIRRMPMAAKTAP